MVLANLFQIWPKTHAYCRSDMALDMDSHNWFYILLHSDDCLQRSPRNGRRTYNPLCGGYNQLILYWSRQIARLGLYAASGAVGFTDGLVLGGVVSSSLGWR